MSVASRDAPCLAALLEGVDSGPALLFSGSPVAQAVLDRGGCLLRANPALRRLAGEPRQNVAALFASAAQDEVRAVLRPLLDGTAPAGVGRGLALAGLGTADLLADAIREADGSTSGVLLHLCDVAGPDPQSAALRDIGQRAAGVAHDVNNLLAVIDATVAEALALPGLDVAAQEGFAEIGNASRRGAALVRRLLDTGAGRDGGMVADVDSALRAMEGPLRRVLGGVALVLVPGLAAAAAVAIDREDFDRVLLNLALNARNAMPAGGTLTVASGERWMAEPASQFGNAVAPGRHVVVTVRDTGTGMTPEVLARLCEPFFTTRAGEGGTGLGLASVRDLVRQAGGFLEVASEPGLGTTVGVHLPWHGAPWHGAPWHGAAPAAPARAAPDGGAVVLLVDDEAGLLRLGERALSRGGWRVLAVSSTAAALAAVEEGVVPCVVVADLVLPDGDGLALVESLRLRCPGVPAVLTSGYASGQVRGRAAAAGVAFLAKPYAMGALLDQVADCVRSRG